MPKQLYAILGALLSVHTSALSIDLGPASGYNIFVKESFSQPGADSQGKVAIGGNANIGQFDVAVNYEPGTHRDGLQFWTNPNQYEDVLVVGGNLTTSPWSWGHVKGNLILGGALTPGSSQHSVLGTTTQGNPIDFNAAFDYLGALSNELAGLGNTGSVGFQYNNWLQLGGMSDADLYVANITGQMLKDATDLTATELTQTDTLVINVSGKNIHFDSLNYGVREHYAALDLSPANILYNFFEAENITFNHGGFRGNILAPKANFMFNSGDLSGQVIVKSWSGQWGAQANIWDGFFTPHLPEEEPPLVTVVESSGWGLVLIGLIGLFFLRQRRLQSCK